MVSRKINTDAIDENLLIASIGKSKIGTTTASILDGASQSQVKDTEEKEEVGWKSQCSQTEKSPISRKPLKASSESYDSAFFKRNEIKTRQCVYISREIHRRISRIVSVLAKHEFDDAVPRIYKEVFGKPTTRVNRRMGVVLCYAPLDSDLDTLRDKAKRIADRVEVY